jgi:tripartite-type tricarboxylate transporter receptor subunit TctC
MKFPRRQFLHLVGGTLTLPAVSRFALAQTYPTRSVRVIVPFAPGGPNDVLARLIAQKLSERHGRQFFIENIAGASSNIGTGHAAKAAPDGHTILITSDAFAINPAFFDKVPYEPFKDFQPVTLAVSFSHVLAINPSVQARTMQELVALIKASSGKYNFASPGTGTAPHLLGEQLRQSLGLDLVHIPFNGGGPAVASVVAGHTPIYIGSPIPAVPHIKDGKLRALAVTGKMRAQALPDVLTMAESGIPDIEVRSWIGVLAPMGTPKDIVTSLNSDIAKIIELPDVNERLASIGFEAVGSSPEDFSKQIKFEFEKWGRVIRAGNIKPE